MRARATYKRCDAHTRLSGLSASTHCGRRSPPGDLAASVSAPPGPARQSPAGADAVSLPFPLPGLQGDWRAGLSPFCPTPTPLPSGLQALTSPCHSPPPSCCQALGGGGKGSPVGAKRFGEAQGGGGRTRRSPRSPRARRQTLFCGRPEPSESFWGPSIPLSLLAPALPLSTAGTQNCASRDG